MTKSRVTSLKNRRFFKPVVCASANPLGTNCLQRKGMVIKMIAVLLTAVLTFVGGFPGVNAGVTAEAANTKWTVKWDSSFEKALLSEEVHARIEIWGNSDDAGIDLRDLALAGKNQYSGEGSDGDIHFESYVLGYAPYVNGKTIPGYNYKDDFPDGDFSGGIDYYPLSGVMSLSFKKYSGSGSVEMGEPGPENTDETIWINGKDTKANAKTGTPASLYKSESFEWAMGYSGGKTQVAVTTGDVTEEKFMTMFDEKGKFDKNAAADAKQYATAKLNNKDGSVTVTAGKTVPSSGYVRVWIYEIKNNTVVNTAQKDNPYYGKYDTDVYPHYYDFDVFAAPDMTVTAKKLELTNNGMIPVIGAPEKLAKGYDAGETVDVYFGDKKNEIDPEMTEYVIWDKKNKIALAKAGETYTGDGYTAKIVTDDGAPYVRISIGSSATEKTKIEVNVMNLQSQKIASIKPKVNKK